MLVLTRGEGEQIRIGDDVIVSILGINRNGKVRVGIEAPGYVRVNREEIHQKIQQERRWSEAVRIADGGGLIHSQLEGTA